jgi:hypothetical protein
MGKPILCVDFDGVIHSYVSGWKGEAVVADPPVKGALAWLWKATEFWDVQIYSSRSKSADGVMVMMSWLMQHAAAEFGPQHPLCGDADEAGYPLKFPLQKPSAFLTIDDRAICFEGDWSELDPADLLNFKPWNKRPLGARGTFSRGQIDEHDQGDIQIGVATDKAAGVIRLAFGKPVAWIGMPPAETIELAKLLLKHAGAKSVEITF